MMLDGRLFEISYVFYSRPTMNKLAKEIYDRIKDLSAKDQETVISLLERPILNERERAFVAEYVARKDVAAAAKAAGYEDTSVAKDPNVRKAVQVTLLDIERKAMLTADYVRQYMWDVLELCPTDYFQLASDGDWVIDPEEFSNLPREVKRLVDGLELKFVGGRKTLKVNFVSKGAVLSLAARYTLTQKLQAAIAVVPWDAVQGVETDSIEERLLKET